MLNVLVFKPKAIKIGSMASFNRLNTGQELFIKDDLDEFYRLIECDTIDIVKRDIGGKCYCVICDDEGLFKQNPLPAIANQQTPNINVYGNIIITGEENNEGELTSLTSEDINRIRNCIIATLCQFKNETYLMAVIQAN